jgi:3-oxoacyl-[acyl-carrier protein] reductase
MSSKSLDGRIALITGGSRGIGGAIAKLFASSGAIVGICHYGDAEGAAEVIAGIEKAGGQSFSFECDVADESAVADLGRWATTTLGRVDILVNCAGIGGDTLFADISVQSWDRMIGVHLRGTFLVTRLFFSGMVERGWGRIINISSQLAYKGAPGLAHYCAAKAGIVGFTRALSYEGAPHAVCVNSIAPGPIETALLAGLSDEWRVRKKAELPAGRFGTVDEIAPTALLLASDAGSYYIGQTLSPNGGDVML